MKKTSELLSNAKDVLIFAMFIYMAFQIHYNNSFHFYIKIEKKHHETQHEKQAEKN